VVVLPSTLADLSYSGLRAIPLRSGRPAASVKTAAGDAGPIFLIRGCVRECGLVSLEVQFPLRSGRPAASVKTAAGAASPISLIRGCVRECGLVRLNVQFPLRSGHLAVSVKTAAGAAGPISLNRGCVRVGFSWVRGVVSLTW